MGDLSVLEPGPGLSAPGTISYDALGTPTINAASPDLIAATRAEGSLMI